MTPFDFIKADAGLKVAVEEQSKIIQEIKDLLGQLDSLNKKYTQCLKDFKECFHLKTEHCSKADVFNDAFRDASDEYKSEQEEEMGEELNRENPEVEERQNNIS